MGAKVSVEAVRVIVVGTSPRWMAASGDHDCDGCLSVALEVVDSLVCFL